MPAIPYEMTVLSGKATVFVRGLIEFVQRSNGEIPLRAAQTAGMNAVEQLGEEISVSYISKLSKTLQTCEIIKKKRQGKKFIVSPDVNFEDFVNFLNESEFGTSLEPEAADEDVMMRSAMLDHMTDVGSVRIEAGHPLDKRAYQILIEKFKQGKYDMVFVHRDDSLYNVQQDRLVETLHESVANR